MSHYRHNVCCKGSVTIQLLVSSIANEEKKQFIPLPSKVEEFLLKNVNKIDEFASHSSISNLKYDEIIIGFDPYNIFQQHL
jgi:hypothetical protein